jgi:hypothetical protein
LLENLGYFLDNRMLIIANSERNVDNFFVRKLVCFSDNQTGHKGAKGVTLYATNRLDRLSLWCKIYVTGEVPGK